MENENANANVVEKKYGCCSIKNAVLIIALVLSIVSVVLSTVAICRTYNVNGRYKNNCPATCSICKQNICGIGMRGYNRKSNWNNTRRFNVKPQNDFNRNGFGTNSFGNPNSQPRMNSDSNNKSNNPNRNSNKNNKFSNNWFKNFDKRQNSINNENTDNGGPITKNENIIPQ